MAGSSSVARNATTFTPMMTLIAGVSGPGPKEYEMPDVEGKRGVRFEPYQQVASQYPDIPVEDFQASIRLITPAARYPQSPWRLRGPSGSRRGLGIDRIGLRTRGDLGRLSISLDHVRGLDGACGRFLLGCLLAATRAPAELGPLHERDAGEATVVVGTACLDQRIGYRPTLTC
jgi:hypothetical protein